MSFSNRRAHQRQSLTAEGWIAVASNDNWSPISTVDVSKGGFGFISREKIEADAICQFRLQLTNDAGLMHVLGRIAHCLELAEIGLYRIGVQTISVDVIDVATMLANPGMSQPDASSQP